ncbi:hypothetical protein O181_043644 [Austropuccinia psidii MF-1]|uniref:Uncharacterized protein n=1 Tax=Austropuccinia psidii MF-1 TaxID=1389203 RepID=A0A9Q3DIG1_9BASI|nr:hypothetical protein [Austropuccinia psidii MF-1]
MSETMVNKRILIKCVSDLDHAIRRRCIDSCSTKDYINAMEEITTRKKIGRSWYKPPIENRTDGKPISIINNRQHIDPLKCHKSGGTSHLANTCLKKTIINEIEIKKAEDTKETNYVSLHESDSQPSEEEELPDQLSIENINVSFEVTEVHTYLPL